ncbi:MAG TPA: response regulator [bacterium]|nr:response regulator [bacterium]
MAHPSTKILLVDDDPDFLEISRGILESAGYQVVVASSPEEAMPLLHLEHPSLVITDLMMVSLDSGFRFVSEIRETEGFQTIPVVMLTAVASQRGFDLAPRSADDLRAMQVDAFIPKPVKPNSLLQTVASLLSKTGENSAR